jgi:hypothetical protein
MRVVIITLCMILLLGSGMPGFCGEKKLPLRDTPEWIQLSRLWREMSEHWAARTYSREKFEVLKADIQLALPSLGSLQARDYLEEKTKQSLEELFQRRYLFIREQRYALTPAIFLADLESYAFRSRTNMEEIGLREFKERTHRELARELEFLRRATALIELIDYHRREAEQQEAKGYEVDWNQFQMEKYRQIRALVDDYNLGRIKPSEETQRLLGHLLSLTEEPLPPAAESGRS